MSTSYYKLFIYNTSHALAPKFSALVFYSKIYSLACDFFRKILDINTYLKLEIHGLTFCLEIHILFGNYDDY